MMAELLAKDDTNTKDTVSNEISTTAMNENLENTSCTPVLNLALRTFRRFTTSDIYDTLPPEILDQILQCLDLTTQFRCATLSKRWYYRVIPHLWYAPWVMYYISWMKLLQTISRNSSEAGLLKTVQSADMSSIGSNIHPQRQQQISSISSERHGHILHAAENQRQGQAWDKGASFNSSMRVVLTTGTTTGAQPTRFVDKPTQAFPHHTHSQHHHQQHPQPVSKPFLPSSGDVYVRPPYGSLIRVLDFSHLYYIISDKFLTNLFPHTPNLLELIINAPKQLSDTSLLTLAESCQHLRRFELLNCTKITDKGLQAVLTHCSDLHTVVLSNGTAQYLSGTCLQMLAHQLAQTLRVLNIASTGGTKTTSLSSSSSTALSSNASASPSPLPSPKLDSDHDNDEHEQDNTNLDATSTPSLKAIALHCKHLVSLNISHQRHLVSDKLLSHLSEPLQLLHIAYCTDVTDRGLINLSEACPNLHELDITGLTLVTDKGIRQIGRRCTQFRKLVLDDKYSHVTEIVLRCFPWGVEVVQHRMLLGGRNSRIF
ncbi:hypothetical protein BG011_002285 [Mortierella polycephala]|uniref:F-box domain-containing protein n=1 Tax=Mortierella polycephala TaxID=41804 RepID=A0A9P6Q5N2_9FUNG|nr:hypothetical protein BG011_002285 [Mortierella polycephala]